MKLARTHNSLQWRLSMGLFAIILLTGALASGASFLWALHDANEILDGTLEDTAGLIDNGQMAVPDRVSQLPSSEPDNDVLVIPYSAAGPQRAGLPDLPDGLHGIEWRGQEWRVLVSRLRSGQRVAIAQRTQVRNEIAQHSAVRTLIPLLLLIPLLILLVRDQVRRTLAPVARLARHVETNAMEHAANLPEVEVPQEIQPFVHAIQGLLDELTTTLAHQQRFVANAAHELRSPVAALRLQAANIESVVEGGEARRRLLELQEGIVRMQHLLEQLLSMARSQSATAGEPGPVRLADLAKEVLAELVVSAGAKGVDLGMERCEANLWVRATPVDLTTLLRNVVENAIKFSPAGAAVTVSVYAEGGDAVVSVEDGGPGIPESQLPNVFEPFYRGPGAAAPGTGLGLSIVAVIAKRLGGTLALSTGPGGEGLRFEFRQARSEPA